MRLTKLNNDSSWLWEIDGCALLVDPWFSPSQIDLAPWFSTQYHTDPQPLVSELPKTDGIFISNPFSDHCNKETLLTCDPAIPVYATASILRKIRKWKHFQFLHELSDAPIPITRIAPKGLLDATHASYYLRSKKHSLLYVPHGCRNLSLPEVDVVITTTTTYTLPFWLGGTVNLGYDAALELKKRCKAKHLLNTHDEQKIGKGLVESFARKRYVTSDQHEQINWVKAGEYIELDQ
jgi:hypothetical protein